MGLLGPFTGPAAAFGQEMLKAAQLALDETNGSGGIDGKRLAIDQADDKSDPSSASAAAQKLAADAAVAVIGPAISASAVAAEAALNQAKLVTIVPNANDPRITDAGLPFIFRASGRWDQEPPLLADEALKSGNKVALLADKSSYGQLLAGGMRQALSKAGVTPVSDESVDNGTKDFGAVTTGIKASASGAPNALFYGGYASEGAAVAKAARAAGLEGTLLMGDAGQDQALITAGGTAVEGMVLAYPPDPKQASSATAFLDAYKKRYGTPASLYAITTYDATRLLVDAIRRAGNTDPEALRQAVSGTRDFGGVYWGKMSFDVKADLQTRTYALWTVRGGKFQQLPG